jgi:Holliday junction resolvasome RuvABC ATP-dependent DNA helicase subunit
MEDALKFQYSFRLDHNPTIIFYRNTTTRILDVLNEKRPTIICIDELDKMPKQFQEKLLNFMESGHIKVDQMRKRYDFEIKGAKVFGACNEITRLSRPLQSRFRRLHLPPYTEDQFLEVSVKVLPNLKPCAATALARRSFICLSFDN